MSKQVRLNFTDKEIDLYEYLDAKTSKSAFIKDLIKREMMRDDNYINCTNQILVQSSNIPPVNEPDTEEYEFDLNDLDLD